MADAAACANRVGRFREHMFVIGALVERWVSISFTPVVSSITQQSGSYIDWTKITADADGIKSALSQYSSLGATGLDQVKTVTLQQNLNQLIPGLAAVCLTLLCCSLLKKKVSPIVIILCLFGVGIIGRLLGFMTRSSFPTCAWIHRAVTSWSRSVVTARSCAPHASWPIRRFP